MFVASTNKNQEERTSEGENKGLKTQLTII